MEQAKKYSNETFEKTYGIINGIEEKNNFYRRKELEEKLPGLTSKQLDKVEEYLNLEQKIFEETEPLRKSSDEYKATDEYFDRVQEVRKLALEKYKAHGEVKGFVDQENLDNLVTPMLPEKKPWTRKPGYQFHPEIDEKNFSRGIGPVMSTYSGKSMAQIEAEIEGMRQEGESLHDVSKRYWNTLEQRTDKPIVSLDLETANPQDKSLDYDNGHGQLTYVIELGAIKTYPDGRVNKKTMLYDIPKEFKDRNGTGFESVHKISPEDITGKPRFSDPKVQKEMYEFMKDSVYIAHNAEFEDKQFTNSLKGYKDLVNKGNIEILDTAKFSKYLIHDTEGNSNVHMVTRAGVEYKDAHRAMNDAEMTLKAFEKLRSNR